MPIESQEPLIEQEVDQIQLFRCPCIILLLFTSVMSIVFTILFIKYI